MHAVFQNLSMTQLNSENFQQHLDQNQDKLVGVFFWGHDCPNCEVAKRSLNNEAEILTKLKITWFHVNTYENFELGTQFGLHGIPTFLFFYQGKKLGKISPYPGFDPFFEALQKLAEKYLPKS